MYTIADASFINLLDIYSNETCLLTKKTDYMNIAKLWLKSWGYKFTKHFLYYGDLI